MACGSRCGYNEAVTEVRTETMASRRADCFTYTSVDKALLEALGVKTMWLENENSPTGDHAWLLVDAGTGWYHFDSTRMYDGFECFMLTDSQVQDYINRGNSIYRRDMSAYPATPSEEFSY